MPLEFREEDGGGVIAMRASGRLRRLDGQRFAPEIDRLIRTRGTVCGMLELQPGFRGWETGAVWEAVRVGLKHLGQIDRLALVGEPAQLGRLRRVCRLLTSADVRCFEPDQADEARAWLRERTTEQTAAEA